MDGIFSRLAAAATLAASAAGCARSAPESPSPAPSARGTATAARATIFTDTALFALHCMQADSGLTPAVGRCTPRDQRQPFRVLTSPPR